MAEPQCGIEGGQPSRQCRGLGAGDPSAVTGDGEIGQARLSPRIECRSPAQLALVPFVAQLQRQTDLNIRDHPLMQQKVIGGDFAPLPNDPIDLAPPNRADPPDAAPDRHAGALDRGDQPQPFHQQPSARPQAR